jgi:hypothetical protein
LLAGLAWGGWVGVGGWTTETLPVVVWLCGWGCGGETWRSGRFGREPVYVTGGHESDQSVRLARIGGDKGGREKGGKRRPMLGPCECPQERGGGRDRSIAEWVMAARTHTPVCESGRGGSDERSGMNNKARPHHSHHPSIRPINGPLAPRVCRVESVSSRHEREGCKASALAS